MRYATAVGIGADRSATEYGQLIADLRTACTLKSDTAVSQARAALDRYHAQRGGRPTSTVRTSTPARGGSGGSLVPIINQLRREIAAVKASVPRAGATMRGDLAAINAVLAGSGRRQAAPAFIDAEDEEDEYFDRVFAG